MTGDSGIDDENNGVTAAVGSRQLTIQDGGSLVNSVNTPRMCCCRYLGHGARNNRIGWGRGWTCANRILRNDGKGVRGPVGQVVDDTTKGTLSPCAGLATWRRGDGVRSDGIIGVSGGIPRDLNLATARGNRGDIGRCQRRGREPKVPVESDVAGEISKAVNGDSVSLTTDRRKTDCT